MSGVYAFMAGFAIVLTFVFGVQGSLLLMMLCALAFGVLCYACAEEE